MGSPADEAGSQPDERPLREVALPRGFWLADTPVTQALTLALMGACPGRFADPEHRDLPVEGVSWHDAVALCQALEERLRRADITEDGRRFRLPSEAEWEYACRAGTTTATYAGDLSLDARGDAPELDAIAWTAGNNAEGVVIVGASDEKPTFVRHPFGRVGPRVVRGRAPNAWGLFDLLGNVREWCLDPWDAEAHGPGADRVDPTATARVVRGGCWFSSARDTRAASRAAEVPTAADGGLGLRLCCGPAE